MNKMSLDSGNLDDLALYRLMTSAIVPRPIALVSTVGKNGVVNAAPFSYFSALCAKPPIFGISIGFKEDGGKKDTMQNIEDTGEFVINVVNEEIANNMNTCAIPFPPEESEIEQAGFTCVDSQKIKAPCIAESPISFECRVLETKVLGDEAVTFIMGEALMIHINQELYDGKYVDDTALHAVGRLAQNQYCKSNDLFDIKRKSLEEFREEKKSK